MIEKVAHILPTIMAAEAFVAGVIYCFAGRWGSAGYWFAASAFTIAVISIPRYG